MSISACGMLYFSKQKVSFAERVGHAFRLQEIANQLKIGILQDAVVTETNRKLFLKHMRENGIFYELTDSPVDDYAERLFGADGCDEYVGDWIPTEDGSCHVEYECLKSGELRERMRRVQEFFLRAFETGAYSSAFLSVDYLEGDPEFVETVRVHELQEALINYYQATQYQVPSLNLTITF